jgi:hypothetical protein
MVHYILIKKNNQYGIKAISEGGKIIKIIYEISTNKNFVENLVNKFNQGNLSVLHFKDAIEDSIE